jgi:polyribonucleotide nucleotidyltransferase
VIQEIQKETGTTIVLEEVGNNGVVSIYAPDETAVSAAEGRIKAIVAVPEGWTGL